MLCFVLALEFQSKALGSISISLSLSLSLCLTLTLSLRHWNFSLRHCDSGIFLGFALFGCCVLLLFIAFGISSSVCFTFVYQGQQN